MLDFLGQTHCEFLYLVGDIIDLECLRRTLYWPACHGEVLRILLKKSRDGTRVIYIPGNTDRGRLFWVAVRMDSTCPLFTAGQTQIFLSIPNIRTSSAFASARAAHTNSTIVYFDATKAGTMRERGQPLRCLPRVERGKRHKSRHLFNPPRAGAAGPDTRA
jgi:hypothetical protein